MIGTQLVYTNPPPQTIEVNAGWQDTVTEFFTFTNHAPHAVSFVRAEAINGTTAGTTTAPIITVSTPNANYVITYPATAMPAGQPAYVDAIGLDRIEEGETIKAVLTATCSAGKEFKFRLILGPAGPDQAA